MPARGMPAGETMLRFHGGHCALCGNVDDRRTFADCTLDTHVLRGYLCGDCTEDVHDGALVVTRAYRARPPAFLLSLRLGCAGMPVR